MRKPNKPLFPTPTGKHWSKRLPMEQRRKIVLRNHENSYLKSGQAMDFLAKGTMDKRTKELASADREYFFKEHRKGKK